MTAGHDGANTPPADDDPFAHLYRPEGGAAAAPGAGQADGGAAPMPTAGVPRTSYTQVRPVGERTYGGGMPQQGYGHPGNNAHYAAPETYGGPPQGPPPGYDDYDDRPRRGGGHGGGRNGLVLGTVAIVVTVAVAIGAAMYFGGGDEGDDKAGDGQSPTAQQSKDTGDKPKKPGALPKGNAGELVPGGTAKLASEHDGALSPNGQYVSGISNPNDSVTWTAKVPEAGKYTLYTRYGVTADAKMSLSVNGADPMPIKMKNYMGAEGDEWDKGWTKTYNYVEAKPGQNTFKISCESGDTCHANVDQMWLVKGWVDK
ncbi:hypothetical protein G5C51_21705 [Streptomyces sp. A7024]|uniref:CBM6 domain-containing protein n=1 Tax=Streptomyces coryli TaxID=1128680 RepID=A0A6G4U2Q1_9ACTN|nr:hypothetical protein [Streptomyces coryli]NGN66505.1 hypothetical protein [Streptomyces coryli]